MWKKRYEPEEEETSYWLSYSDMLAGLLLVFVLIITFTMLQAKTQYEEKERQLATQQELLLEQRQLVEKQQKIMEEQQARLDKIIGIRAELVHALKEEFSGTDLTVTVDEQTGAITFDSSILFDYNKSGLKEVGQGFLEDFYQDILEYC